MAAVFRESTYIGAGKLHCQYQTVLCNNVTYLKDESRRKHTTNVNVYVTLQWETRQTVDKIFCSHFVTLTYIVIAQPEI